MDSLLALLVIGLLAAFSNWLQRRAQSRQDRPPDSPTPVPRPISTPRRPRPTARPTGPVPTLETNLERELRRLLGEESPAPVPPPIEPRVPIPTPHSTPAPLAPPPRPPVIAPPSRPVLEPVPSRTQADLTQPGASYDRAQRLHETVADRLKRVDEQTEKHGPKGLVSSAPLTRTKRGFALNEVSGNPEAARQAFIASLIFSAPKGFES